MTKTKTDTTVAPTKGQAIAADISALLRARNPLLWIVTREEARAERHVFEAAAAAGYKFRTWDVGQGVQELNGRGQFVTPAGMSDLESPDAAMLMINTRADNDASDRCVWVLRDLHAFGRDARVCRLARNLARKLPSVESPQAQALVVISPSGDLPPELAAHAIVIEWALPDRAEIAQVLDATLENLKDDVREKAVTNGARERVIDSAVGLTGEEAAACFAKSLVLSQTVDPLSVAQEKKQIITRERVLEWYDPLPGGLDAVGGLEHLKAWLMVRMSAYSPQARAYGLPMPKGTMVVGIPGTGKSLISKAIATAWGVPLLKLDLGALKSKFVGESEGNLRKALKVIEAIGRCVVWVDEIEKALQGATSGSADGGVSSDALGTLLQWMQERQGGAFVIATANDVSALPPELLRKGRFDEMWFVDLPNPAEREAVVAAALRAHGRTIDGIDLKSIAKATDQFTGAEIAALVPDALFAAFNDGAREPTTGDLTLAAKDVTPLARTAADRITKLREWATTKGVRPASKPLDTAKASGGRKLDL